MPIITLTTPENPTPVNFDSIGATTNYAQPASLEPGSYSHRLYTWLKTCEELKLATSTLVLKTSSSGPHKYVWYIH